jgi:hypothetical protein
MNRSRLGCEAVQSRSRAVIRLTVRVDPTRGMRGMKRIFVVLAVAAHDFISIYQTSRLLVASTPAIAWAFVAPFEIEESRESKQSIVPCQRLLYRAQKFRFVLLARLIWLRGRVAVEEEESQKPEFMKTILRLARVFAVVKRKRRRGRGDSRSRPTTTSATAQSDGLRSSESRTKDSIKILIRWLASLSRLDIIRCLTHATPRTSSSKSVSAISRSDAYQRG